MDSGRTGGTGRPSVRDAAWVVLYLTEARREVRTGNERFLSEAHGGSSK